MGIPNITTNLSGFGCFMEDLLEKPEVSWHILTKFASSLQSRTTDATSSTDEVKASRSLSASS